MQSTPTGTRPDVAALLARMQDMRAAAQSMRADAAAAGMAPAVPGAGTASVGGPAGAGHAAAVAGPVPAGTSFTQHLSRALAAVNATQRQASALADGFVRGEHGDLVGVMVAAQKSSVAFTAATQVRNRLVSAYESIMNMPI
jgi:flagellar hook-basal body complex protein FliE